MFNNGMNTTNVTTGPGSTSVEQLTGTHAPAAFQAKPDDPDTAASTTEQQVSTKAFIEQRQVLHEQSIIPSSLSRTVHLKQQSMPERGHSLQSTFVVPYLISTIAWDTTQGYDRTIWRQKIPSILNAVPAPARAMLRTYAYYKADFTLRFQLNSTKFHLGRLVAAWWPMDHHIEADIDPWVIQAVNQPHIQLDASESTVAELQIPYQTIYNFLTTNTDLQTDSLGTVTLTVLNKLNVSGASNSVTVAVYLYSSDVSLHVPIEDHTPILNATVEPVIYHAGNVANVPTNPPIDGGSSAFDDLGSAAYKLITSVGASAIGLDHPPDPTTMTRGVSKALSSISAGAGIDHIEVLDTIPLADHQQTPSQRGIAKDEMNLRQVVKRVSLFNILDWTTSDASGHNLGHWAVSPLLVSSSELPTTPVKYNICPTFLAYVSQDFCYWKGGIRFRFEVVCTSFHTGRLLIAWIPNVINYTNTPSMAACSAYPSTIFDLQQRKEFEVVVPYDTTTSWKKTSNLDPNSVYDPRRPDMFGAPTSFECYNGYFVIYVQSKLCAPSNVAQAIQINCYVSGDDDFYLRALTNVGPKSTIYMPPPASEDEEVEFHSGQLVSGGAQQPQQSFWNGGLGTSYQSTPGDLTMGPTGSKAQYGDSKLSLKEEGSILKSKEMDLHWILSKYHLRGWQNLGGDPHVNLTSPVRPSRNDSYSPDDYLDRISRYAQMYVFWTGSLNHKILLNTNKNQSTMGFIYHNVSPSATFPSITKSTGSFENSSVTPGVRDLSMHAQAINFAFQDCFEVCTPQKTIYDRLLTQLPTSGITDPYANASGILDIVIQQAPDYKNVYLNHFMAIGNDFQFMFMVAPPRYEYEG
jgi:hypothetical protein